MRTRSQAYKARRWLRKASRRGRRQQWFEAHPHMITHDVVREHKWVYGAYIK
jgi:hypothetical protein